LGKSETQLRSVARPQTDFRVARLSPWHGRFLGSADGSHQIYVAELSDANYRLDDRVEVHAQSNKHTGDLGDGDKHQWQRLAAHMVARAGLLVSCGGLQGAIGEAPGTQIHGAYLEEISERHHHDGSVRARSTKTLRNETGCVMLAMFVRRSHGDEGALFLSQRQRLGANNKTPQSTEEGTRRIRVGNEKSALRTNVVGLPPEDSRCFGRHSEGEDEWDDDSKKPYRELAGVALLAFATDPVMAIGAGTAAQTTVACRAALGVRCLSARARLDSSAFDPEKAVRRQCKPLQNDGPCHAHRNRSIS
jgi:hypothetical protein